MLCRTTELTTTFATSIANAIGLEKAEKGVEVVVRAVGYPLSHVNIVWNHHYPVPELTSAADILRAQSNIQWNHVGTVHQSSSPRDIYHPS
jgi:hypothetical protein